MKRTKPNDKLLPEIISLLNDGHSVTLTLRGYSMRPFLEDSRDKALLVAVDNKGTRLDTGEPIRNHDVVLAEIKPGLFVLHRIIRIANDELTLCGDGNITDEHCHLSDVKAIAKEFYRKGRIKPDTTTGRKWRTYSWLWIRLRPLRRYLLYIYRLYHKLFVSPTNVTTP